MAYARDPVSELFDSGARRLLARAYSHPGTWAATRIADPAPHHTAWLATRGIDPNGPDNPSAEGGRAGGLNARSRWVRGFVRALYFNHKWYSGAGAVRSERRAEPRHAGALEVQVGRRVVPRGIIPAGYAVRVRIRPGGQAKLTAVRRKSERDRIYDDAGQHAARSSDPERRDW